MIIFLLFEHNKNGDYMNSEYEILDYIYKNASMGYESTMTLLKSLKNKDNKIKNDVQDIINSYEQFKKESELLLAKINADGSKVNPVASISVDMNIIMKTMKDNSDAAIAKMLIKGLTMGQNNMSKVYDNISENIDKKTLKLLNNFKDFQTNAIRKLEAYI